MLRFRTAQGVYLVRAESVIQVRDAADLKPFPGHRADVLGLVEKDGLALPVLGTMGPAGHHVVLLGAGGRTFGVAVEEVLGIARVAESDVGPPPSGSAQALIAGVVKSAEGFELVISADELGRQLDDQVPPAKASASLAEELPLRLLVVEDNVVVQTMTKRMMRKLGYSIDLAATGKAAIDAMERTAYDLVFMDVQMPEMDGLTAMREIARRWPTGRPPVIAMSAENAESERQNCLDAGMNDYVAKPVREPELNAILRKWGAAPGVAPGSSGHA